MNTKITAMLLVLACAPALAQSDYIDGEFQGRRGWIPDDDRSPEYYLGYSEGREGHENIADMLREMHEESDRERRHDELMETLRGLNND